MGLGQNQEGVDHMIALRELHKYDRLADKIEALIRECEEERLDFVAYCLEMAKQELRPDNDA